ncbi:MAG: hypothetical protein A3D74_02800 [Candidatus Levybacteria bacterium RIFCSPHIGHO2_02_FULL_37_13]|nr:MAG: hypothetical protein A3D74_02800 [Candidatus Levybacteria bacterium RIFCSPHIGHO2_02_FULL_37_13]OGH30691.1 MAG: hypothetical protein A3E40_01560 [Candidatus Levybacteria bacterium RIFCSPHIGHO2_12_FULL_37_9]OGH39355.1 MAG: hypothetical protein A3B41_01705 [Candidatus Levybacteria bacterium RIFCSPLOWO2_01_FULL_37_26]
MEFLRKHRLFLAASIGISILYFFSRVYNILELPIFTDEAIYVRWAQIANNDASWRFISLVDGKQPSFIWAMMVVMRLVDDPLLAGRLTSVIAGLFSVIGLYFLGREIFRNSAIGIISSFIYVVFPMAIVYDRLALYESLVGAFAVWSLYFVVLLVRRMRLDIALILGLVIGGGVLTKTSGFFSIYLLPISLLLFDFKLKDKYLRILKWVGLAFVSIIISYAIYSILRLSPYFYIIEDKNALFVYPFKEWIEHPFRFWYGNILGEWDWLRRYLTMSGILLIFLSFFIDKKFLREKIMLTMWFLIPFAALALFGKTLYPRFIFFMTLALIPLIAFSVFKIKELVKNKILLFGVFALLLFFPLNSGYLIVNNFSESPIPAADLEQYSNGWTSGAGVKEIVEFLEKEANDKKIFVGTQGTFGLMPYALEIYLVKNKNITITGFWPIEETLPKELDKVRKQIPTYFLFYQPCNMCANIGEPPASWPVTLVSSYVRGIGIHKLSLYRINP